MAVSVHLLIVSLCIIYFLHKTINDYINKNQRPIISQLDYPTFEIRNDYQHEDVPLSNEDMQKALQQYLNTHLQQHTPQEINLENQYDIIYSKEKTVSKHNIHEHTDQNNNNEIVVLTNGELSTNIQPFVQDSMYAAI